ncbi:MAG: sulfatase-like hydrolase/transferase [Proteobacteria bacterium]|nr:sulfatase-like hydrolase/transferase [Pseudomonadota bacterium]
MWRDLLYENARAELDVRGPVIDFGTAEQHKYTRGEWGTGWGETLRRGKSATYTTAVSMRASFVVVTRERPRELALRMRSRAAGQRVEAYWNGRRLGRLPVGKGWDVLRFAIPRQVASPGRHQVLLSFRKGRPHLADVDWAWLRTGAKKARPQLGPRMGPLRLGTRTRRALLAPTARSYSFYLHVPKGGFLSFDYGADRGVEFRVRVQPARGATRELFRRTSSPGSWHSTRVDLSRFSGQAIRLELTTRGPAGHIGWGAPELRVPGSAPARPPITGIERPKNVVLIVYDTTRADVFRPFNRSSRVKTPHFDALAKRSTVFVNAYNNESWTRPSTITILTGLYPETHGAIYSRSVLDDEVEMISEHLAEHDFRRLAIVGNAVLRAKFGMDQGWNEYRNHGRDDHSAERIYGEAAQWVEKHYDDGRFFLYIHSYDSHTPYAVDRSYSQPYYPKPYRGFVGNEFTTSEQLEIAGKKRSITNRDMQWIRALYDGEASYQDHHFGLFIDKLDELGILDDTLIVVTNDHGEELHEHGGMGHGWTLYEEQLRAPLLIHYPRLFPRDHAVADIVEHVDVAPTIVEALGLSPLQSVDGLSLVPLVTGRGAAPRPYYAVASLRDVQRSIRVGRWKLVVEKDKPGWKHLHDLRTDPGELHDLAATQPIAGRLCEIYLGEALASPAKSRRLASMTGRRRFKTLDIELDSAIKRELEALGYFGNGEFDRPAGAPKGP